MKYVSRKEVFGSFKKKEDHQIKDIDYDIFLCNRRYHFPILYISEYILGFLIKIGIYFLYFSFLT